MRPIEPTTPPTTGAAVGLEPEDVPTLACDCVWSEVEAGEEFRKVFEGACKPLPMPFPDTMVGEACKSLCATANTVLDEVVGVVPFDAGNAVALTTAACVVDDVLITAAEEKVVASIAVVLATDETAATLTEVTAPAPPPTTTFG
jgi:hypothetical protein